MSTWYDALWPGIKAAIASAWPDIVPGNLMSDVEAQKRDWTNLLDSQEMAPPWVVVKLDPAPTDEWGVGAVSRYSVATTIFYIDNDSAAGTGGHIVGFILDKLLTLQQTLLTTALIPATVLTEMTPNANAENPVNMTMLSADQRFTAGSIMFTAITG